MFFSKAMFASPRVERPELIDTIEPSDADFAGSFADIARVNRYLGGTRAVRNALVQMIRPLPLGQTVTILDIATGSADIPRTIIKNARQGIFGEGRKLAFVATDLHPKVLALAARLTPNTAYPEIQVESADAFNLPYPDRYFDFALCSLAFHHFGPADCVRALREMERVTTRGFVVNDLIRDRLAASLISITMRTLRANPLSIHDAPVSVMRAFTLSEYEQMARDAGLVNIAALREPMYRAVLIRDKQLD